MHNKVSFLRDANQILTSWYCFLFQSNLHPFTLFRYLVWGPDTQSTGIKFSLCFGYCLAMAGHRISHMLIKCDWNEVLKHAFHVLPDGIALVVLDAIKPCLPSSSLSSLMNSHFYPGTFPGVVKARLVTVGCLAASLPPCFWYNPVFVIRWLQHLKGGCPNHVLWYWNSLRTGHTIFPGSRTSLASNKVRLWPTNALLHCNNVILSILCLKLYGRTDVLILQKKNLACWSCT